MAPIPTPIPTPVAIQPSIFPLPSQAVTAKQSFTLVTGVLNQKIRLFHIYASVSAGTFTMTDSGTKEVILSGSNGSLSGYKELSSGASLNVTCDTDCNLTAYVTTVIQ